MTEARQYPRGAVASPHYLASGAGLHVLASGGNAVDAAVAMNLVLGVVTPYLCGYGGDLFAVVWDGELRGYQSAGRSASAASAAGVRAQVESDHMPTFGPHTVTVPGGVKGWFDLLDRWGSRDFGELSAAALDYATDGFPLTVRGALSFEMVRRVHGASDWADDLCSAYAADLARPGHVLRQPALARTIRALAEAGPDAFYSGEIATDVAATVQRHGGALRVADLEAHQSAWVDPLKARFGDVEVAELPPPTQGVTALEGLRMASRLDLGSSGDSADRHHLLVEIAKSVLADRNRYVTDPEHMPLTADSLLDDGFIEERIGTISAEQAAQREPLIGPDGGTAYLCAADDRGLLVSLIQSNFSAIGSGVHVPEWGINLQNRGSSFSLEPDDANVLAPSKLPMHTLIPAMVLRDDRPELVFGTMGGHGQAQTHLQVLIRRYLDSSELHATLSAPRWCVDPTSWRLDVEDRFGDEWVDAMRARGHDVNVRSSFDMSRMGHAHAIAVGPYGFAVVSDPRAEGAALGW